MHPAPLRASRPLPGPSPGPFWLLMTKKAPSPSKFLFSRSCSEIIMLNLGGSCPCTDGHQVCNVTNRGRISPQSEPRGAGRVPTHSGYQPLKNNIKGRTKNTDSVLSRGESWGQRQGEGAGQVWVDRSGGKSPLAQEPPLQRAGTTSQPIRRRRPSGPILALCSLASFPSSPVSSQVNLIWVK